MTDPRYLPGQQVAVRGVVDGYVIALEDYDVDPERNQLAPWTSTELREAMEAVVEEARGFAGECRRTENGQYCLDCSMFIPCDRDDLRAALAELDRTSVRNLNEKVKDPGQDRSH